MDLIGIKLMHIAVVFLQIQDLVFLPYQIFEKMVAVFACQHALQGKYGGTNKRLTGEFAGFSFALIVFQMRKPSVEMSYIQLMQFFSRICPALANKSLASSLA